MNESLLTGESDLIKKQPGSELMSGSFIDSGLLRARVIHVGADNYVAKINNEAKYVKKVNSEIMNVLNAIVRFASIIMIPLGLALFASSVSELWDAAGTPGDSALSWCFSELLAGHVPSSALLSTVGALLGMIPQGLVLLTSSVLAIATVRLGPPQGAGAAALLHRDARSRRCTVPGQDGHHHVGPHGGRGHVSAAG